VSIEALYNFNSTQIFHPPFQVGEALHIVRILSGLLRASGDLPFKDDEVSVGGTGGVLCSCVSAVCMLYARVCIMSLAAEMISKCSPEQQLLWQLLPRVQDTVANAAKVACLSVALASGGVVYQGIVSLTIASLRTAQLPVYVCECFDSV
jgi:hypothetical protein